MSKSKLAVGNHFLLPVISLCILFLSASTHSECSRLKSPTSKQEGTVTQIYAEADWYRARPEPEKEWDGVLREREVTVGPANRTALTYQLVTANEQIPVYAANVERKLAPFVGRRVLIYGKLVDLSSEGFEPELWIASIRTSP